MIGIEYIILKTSGGLLRMYFQLNFNENKLIVKVLPYTALFLLLLVITYLLLPVFPFPSDKLIFLRCKLQKFLQCIMLSEPGMVKPLLNTNKYQNL